MTSPGLATHKEAEQPLSGKRTAARITIWKTTYRQNHEGPERPIWKEKKSGSPRTSMDDQISIPTSRTSPEQDTWFHREQWFICLIIILPPIFKDLQVPPTSPIWTKLIVHKIKSVFGSFGSTLNTDSSATLTGCHRCVHRRQSIPLSFFHGYRHRMHEHHALVCFLVH